MGEPAQQSVHISADTDLSFALSRNVENLPGEGSQIVIDVMNCDSNDLPSDPRRQEIAVFVAPNTEFGVMMRTVYLDAQPNVRSSHVDANVRTPWEMKTPLTFPSKIMNFQGSGQYQLGVTHRDRKIVRTTENDPSKTR